MISKSFKRFTIIGLLMFFFLQYTMAQKIMIANPEATKTIDGTLDEMLRIVNGEKGKQRNWEAWKDLFLPSVRFTVVYNKTTYETATLDEMIVFMQDDYYDNGYKETSLSRHIEFYNGIAQVLEVVNHIEPDGNSVRGVNSTHLIFQNNRWWISNVIWTMEEDNDKIPEKYLKH